MTSTRDAERGLDAVTAIAEIADAAADMRRQVAPRAVAVPMIHEENGSRERRKDRLRQRPEGLSMSAENKAIVRRFFAEVINAGHTDRAEEVVTADYVERQHVPGAEGCQGIEVAKAFLSMMRDDAPSLPRLPAQRRGSGRRSGRGGSTPHRERRTPGGGAGAGPDRQAHTDVGHCGVPLHERHDGRVLGHVRCARMTAADQDRAEPRPGVVGAHARLPREEATSHSALREVKPSRAPVDAVLRAQDSTAALQEGSRLM